MKCAKLLMKITKHIRKRLGESFKQVSERLELVHKGLGEMQSVATDVGDLKKYCQMLKLGVRSGNIN
jgi:Uncharacterized protein conserved in bacteria